MDLSDTSHLIAGWLWILAGLLTGTLSGVFFHRDDWLGGYGSWSRRMTRLGHIAFVGTGLLNIALGVSVHAQGWRDVPPIASGGLLAGAFTMPLVCYLSAWRPAFRRAFVVPVVSLLLGVGELLRCLIAR